MGSSSRQKLEAIRCKAAVCWGVEEMVVEEIEVAPPRESEVRVKMLCASLCHTDVRHRKGFALSLFPRVLGHEGVGVVESVGEGVTDFKEGDTVIPTYVGECGECTNCRSPNSSNNFCTKFPPSFLTGLMPDGTSRMSSRGHKLYHFFTCSTLSEYTVVNVNYLVNLPSPIPLPHASLLTCGYSTGFGAAWKEAKVEKGSSVAVFGLGAVGLGVVEGSRVCGATKIIGVDVNELKREKGEAFGITHFLNPREISEKSSMAEVIKEMTGGLGVDYSFECTGVAAPLMNDAMDCTKNGQGLTIMLGIGKESSINLNIMPFFAGKTLKGSIFGGLRPRSDLPYIIDKSINKELHLGELVTHRVQLGEINHAFDQLLKQPDSIKIIIQFGNEGVSG